MESLLFLFISLVIILFSCMVFSNAIEWLGSKLNLSHGVTGSVLAAVGTALPETMVPLVAIFGGLSLNEIIHTIKYGSPEGGSMNDISMGAIIGAPFMLITLAFFLIGITSFYYYKSGTRKSMFVNVDMSVFRRDIKFFIISLSLAFAGIFLSHLYRVVIALVLIFLYIMYLIKTFKEEKQDEFQSEDLEDNLDPLISKKLFPAIKHDMGLIISQLIFSLVCLIFSAHHFVHAIEALSHVFHFPAFVISLLLTPIATELPEKFNSWLWIKGNKDTLAVSNVSGALVFQSTFPVSIGLLFTSWKVTSSISYFIFGFCILNALFLLYAVRDKNISYKAFLNCGIFYLIYLILIFTMI